MSCNHKSIKVIYLNDGVHYGKRQCKNCNAFIRWLPKPSYKGDQHIRNNQIKQLIKSKPLNDFEQSFLSSIYRIKDLTDKQNSCFERIVDRHC